MNQDPTFKVDNWLLQNVPTLYATQRYQSDIQLSLPGFEPFSQFDLWATLALYSLLDPKKPTASVNTTLTELAGVLGFAKKLSEATGYQTVKSKHFAMVEEALHRLYTVEVSLKGYYQTKAGKDRKTKRPQYVDYHGRILTEFAYIYAPGVKPPEDRKASERENVNLDSEGKPIAALPIWKVKTEKKVRPVGVIYTIGAQLVAGLAGDNIQATTFPKRVFALRKTVGQKPTATRLLLWVIRQTKRELVIGRDKLEAQIAPLTPRSKKGHNKARQAEAIEDAFRVLKDEGVIESFDMRPQKDGRESFYIVKADGWHYPTLPADMVIEGRAGATRSKT